MKIRDDYTCPLEIVHDIIKGKWKTIILYQMKDGPRGLAELEREIEGITQKMLLEQLKELIVINKGILSENELCRLVKEAAEGNDPLVDKKGE